MTRNRWTAAIALASAGTLAALATAQEGEQPGEPDKQEAPYVTPEKPGLAVGDEVNGEVTLQDREGEEVALASLHESKPVIITFYRGGRCPFCNEALQQWQGRMDDVDAAGAEFIAVTMEKPEYVEETIQKQDLGYRIFVDAEGKVAEAFKVKFDLSPDTQKRYKGWGLNVDEHNVNGEWQLPAPGTFVIDTSGVVRYAFADWDYKKRADPDEVLAALKGVEASAGDDAGE